MTLNATTIFYMLLGLASIVPVFVLNRELFRTTRASPIEYVLYVTALAALLVGWYFNIAYMNQYGAEAGWWHWTKLLFVNPASASGGQDLIFANVILFPIWTILDGRRAGLRWPWWYFVMSIVTSFAFAMALFLAVRDRQLRAAPA